MRFEFGVVCMFVFVNKGERGNEKTKRKAREKRWFRNHCEGRAWRQRRGGFALQQCRFGMPITRIN